MWQLTDREPAAPRARRRGPTGSASTSSSRTIATDNSDAVRRPACWSPRARPIRPQRCTTRWTAQTWTEGAAVTITQDAVVSFIAITADGIASAVVSPPFTKRVTWDDAVTADAVDHFVAGRIDVTDTWPTPTSSASSPRSPCTWSTATGCSTRAPAPAAPTAEEIEAIDERAGRGRPLIRPTAPDPRTTPDRPRRPGPPSTRHRGAGAGPTGHACTTPVDGTIPNSASESFVGSAIFELTGTGNQVIACRVADDGTAQLPGVSLRSAARPPERRVCRDRTHCRGETVCGRAIVTRRALAYAEP